MPFKSNHPEGSRKGQLQRFINSFPVEMRYTVVYGLLMECSKKISRRIIDDALAIIREELRPEPKQSEISGAVLQHDETILKEQIKGFFNSNKKEDKPAKKFWKPEDKSKTPSHGGE